MKLKHFFALFIAMFLHFGCSKQPIGNSLLTSASSRDLIDGSTSTDDDGELDIQPDSTAMTVSVDDADKVEITGNCKDKDRKKNRIIVEVFAGDDETQDPYISNSASDMCQNVVNDAGLFAPLTKCFWVTKGIGLIEDANLPTQRSFPQCHGGRFGFSVKLGKILVPSIAGPNTKYTVRFKLRTLDGILADSTYSRVSVARELSTPVIDSVMVDQSQFSCTVSTSPARFNWYILYKLTRTHTDVTGTSVESPIFDNYSTFGINSNDSVFSWKDDRYSHIAPPVLPSPPVLPPPVAFAPLGIIAGVKYNYKLTATDMNYSYATSQDTTSSTVSCETSAPTIFINGALNVAGSCPMAMIGNMNIGLATQWARSTTPNWTGPNSDKNDGSYIDMTGSCGGFGASVCTMSGLPNNVTQYIAVREIGFGQIGKWSAIVQCKPP